MDLARVLDEGFVREEERINYYAYEYAAVIDTERETPTCVRIDFDSTSIGFPLDYNLTIRKRGI